MAAIILDPSGHKFTIVRFRDGDTLEGFLQCNTCSCAREMVIRVRKIDSWELNDPTGRAKALFVAQEATKLYRGEVGIFVGNPKHRDKYGRTVGDVWIGGELLSNLLVFKGLAWYIPAGNES